MPEQALRTTLCFPRLHSRSRLSCPAASASSENFLLPGWDWGGHVTLAMQMSPQKCSSKPPMPADFVLSQWCKQWRASTTISLTLSQPGFNKSLPMTCNLPGNALVGFAKSRTQIYSDDGTFFFSLFTPLPSSVSKQPWVVISCMLLSHCLQKHRENQNAVGKKTQAGLNTNINNSDGVGPGTILFFTFHSAFKKHNHLRAPKDTSSSPL